MLRAIFFHHGDCCREWYEALNTVVDADPFEWARNVEYSPQLYLSEFDGWCIHPWTGYTTCPACVPEIEIIAESTDPLHEEEDF